MSEPKSCFDTTWPSPNQKAFKKSPNTTAADVVTRERNTQVALGLKNSSDNKMFWFCFSKNQL